MRILFIAAVSLLIVIILFWTRPDTHFELQAISPPRVNIVAVEQRDIQPIYRVTGKLQPSRKAGLHFQVSGQINERRVEAGQYVEKDSALLSVEDDDFINAVDEAEALLETERDAIRHDLKLLALITQDNALQEKEVERLAKLDRESLASRSNYDQTLQKLYRQQAEAIRLERNIDAARSRLLIQRIRLEQAQRNLRRTTLRAPFDGRVNTVNAEVGDYVSPGQVALEIVQTDSLDLSLEVTGAVAAELSLGQKVMIETPREQREGTIIALTVDSHPETNTHALRIRLPSNDLFAGRLAVSRLPGRLYDNASVVPIGAVLYEEGTPFVFVHENERVFKKPITVVERYNDLNIIEGIEVDTKIVSRDVAGLTDGQVVVAQ